MSARRCSGVPRHRPALALLLGIVLAGVVAGCGGGPTSDLGAYVGAWSRIEGGEPDPQSSLLVERRDGAVWAEFTGPQGTMSGRFAAEDGHLFCEHPEGGGAYGVTGGLQLSLDEPTGQVVVDRVLDDGTSEPMWVYERAPSVAPSSATLEP